MKSDPRSDKSSATPLSDQQRKVERRQQLLGITGGVGLGMMLLAVVPSLAQSPGWVETLLWMGALGGVLASLPAFERAGAVLTRRDNRLLNLAVSLGIVILFLAALVYILR